MAAAAPTPVAYNDPSDNYERRVRRLLEKLGSKDPDGDMAACGEYVVRARDAEIDPQVVASTVWLKTHEGEGPAPGSRFGRTSAWGAEERPSRPGYYAVDPNGRIIAGPFTERRFAEPHAGRVHGYIQFEPGEAVAPTTLIVAAEAPKAAETFAACPGGEGGACGCGQGHELPAPEAVLVIVAEEAYGKTLHWHRDPKKEQKYFANAGALGKFVVERRPPDRRHGVLPWTLTLEGREIRPLKHGTSSGYDSKSDAQGRAARYAKKPEGRAAAEAPAAAEPPPRGASDCIAIVERVPGCARPGRVVENERDVYDLLHARYERQGHEVYEVLLLNLNDELIGSPVQVASGQRSKVMVDIEQVLAPVIKGAEAGCVSFYAIHGHPSGSAGGSPSDKSLTESIAKAAKIACPATTFRDHLVIGYREVYSCKKGRIVHRRKP